MGKIAHGPFGGVSGAVGNVVGSSWMGIHYFRIRSAHHHDPKTETQINQRNRFKGIVLLSNLLREDLINPIWRHMAVRMTPTNLFIRANMQAFDQDGKIGDYSLLKVSVGSLPLPFNMSIKASEDSRLLDVTWGKLMKPIVSRNNDKLNLFIMMGGDMVIIPDLDATRSDLKASVAVPYKTGDTIQVYAFFSSPDGEAYSESFHSVVTLN
ncbi:hypothetical protein EYV94_27510 [Puteibacter caeruleilacunae]|nr:hypothetical protein EYV94_27510 [Puteibacter caeruleilacunae]